MDKLREARSELAQAMKNLEAATDELVAARERRRHWQEVYDRCRKAYADHVRRVALPPEGMTLALLDRDEIDRMEGLIDDYP